MNNSITLLDGIRNKMGEDAKILTAPGGKPKGDCPKDMIKEACSIVKKSDIVVLAVGENGIMSGENTSRTDLTLPGNQEELVAEISALGKPVILVVFAGRPLVLTNIIDKVDAVLFVWQPGALGGAAIADVLFGDYNPSGKSRCRFPMPPVRYLFIITALIQVSLPTKDILIARTNPCFLLVMD